MPALDSCHLQVVHALEKAGWKVEPKPFVLRLDRLRSLHIDIEAHHVQQESLMVVEVKCFQNEDAETSDLYTAVGQYLIYRDLLKERKILIPLYLAVPVHAYQNIFQRIGMLTVTANRIKMLVVDMEREVIVKWMD